MKSNISKHSCANKCIDFKEEQCKTCLVQDRNIKQWYDVPKHHMLEQAQLCSLEQIEKREFELGVAPDEAYVKECDSDFLIGDAVVFAYKHHPNILMTVTGVNDHGSFINVDKYPLAFRSTDLRQASVIEFNAKRRLTNAELSQAEVS